MAVRGERFWKAMSDPVRLKADPILLLLILSIIASVSHYMSTKMLTFYVYRQISNNPGQAEPKGHIRCNSCNVSSNIQKGEGSL